MLDAANTLDADGVTLTGGDGNDVLVGGAGDDVIMGGGGADILHGGEGNDTLDPGPGGTVTTPERIYGEGGDDTLVIDGAQDGRFMLAYGGTGTDTVFISTTTGQVFGFGWNEFERLVVQSALNVSSAHNFSEIVITDDFVNFANSINPMADIVLNNQFLMMAFSHFRSVTGLGGAENVWLGQGSVIYNAIRLGDGDDRLVLDNYWSGPAPSVPGADGEGGSDQIDIWSPIDKDLVFDLTNFTGFERFGFNSEYGDRNALLTVSNLVGITEINVGQTSSIDLRLSYLPTALLRGAFGGQVTIGEDATIGRYGMPLVGPWNSSTDLTYTDPTLSVTFVNRGRVISDIAFYVGNDMYDGTAGSIGGTVYGNSGDDVLLGGTGDEQFRGGHGADRLVGNSGNDSLYGDAGDDVIEGGEGDDLLLGNAGVDLLFGGAGADTYKGTIADLSGDTILGFQRGDRLVLSDANFSNFHFSFNGALLSFAGGSIILGDVQEGRLVATPLAGGGVQLALSNTAVRGDFNGDGRSDAALLDASSAFASWSAQADGSFVGSQGSAANALDASWRIVGMGDFNADGEEDLLWRHVSGEIGQWQGRPSGTFVNTSDVAANPVDNSWSVAGVADYNGDGRDDILWRHESGAITEWLAQPNASFTNNSGAAANLVDNSWSVVGSGDFDGDGRADVLWRHSSGVFAEWQGTASGALRNIGSVLPGAVGSVVGTGDFNGDGRQDILTRASNGLLTVRLGDTSGQFTSAVPSMQIFDLNWKVVGIGDYNGDARDDLLWRHSSGVTAEWLGSSNGNFAHSGVATPAIEAGWQIQSPDIFLV